MKPKLTTDEPFPLPRPEKARQTVECVVCGNEYEPKTNLQKYCSRECAAAGGEAKAVERKLKTGKSSGAGRAVRSQTRTKFEYAQLSDADRIALFPAVMNALAKTGNIMDAAQMVTGNPRHGPGFQSFAMKNPQRKAQYLEAAQVGGNIWNKQAYKLGVEGIDEPVVSMGQVIATKKVFSEKIVLAYARKNDAELVRANSASSTNVNLAVQLNTGMEQRSGDDEPTAFIKLSEVHRLSPQDRDALARIYGLILAARTDSPTPPSLDWAPEESEIIEGELVDEDSEYAIPEGGI